MPWWTPIVIAFVIMAFYATVAHREQRRRERESAWRKKYEHRGPTRLTPPSQRDKPSDAKSSDEPTRSSDEP